MDTSKGSSVHFALAIPLTLLDIMPSLVSVRGDGGGDVLAQHNTLRGVLAETYHWAHLGVQVEAGNNLTCLLTFC